jgi:hypothetical protein
LGLIKDFYDKLFLEDGDWTEPFPRQDQNSGKSDTKEAAAVNESLPAQSQH